MRCIIISSSDQKLRHVKELLPNAITYQYNLENVNNIEDIFYYLENLDIEINALVYCAGISPLCLLKDNTIELTEKVFRVNYFSFYEMVRQFYIHADQGGKIVAVGSITRLLSGYRQTLYGGSKNALVASVRLIANEIMDKNITINCVSPGVSETNMLSNLKSQSDNLEEKIKKNQPLGIIPPDKIADVVGFILSPSCSHITGKEWLYDGGAIL